MVSAKRAFTLIELLVVVAVIATLASLILVGANLLRERAKGARTETAFGVIQQAVAVAATEGRGPAPVIEHPLAGSAAPRVAFARRRDGSAIATTGTAFTGIGDPARMPPGQAAQVLLTDDLHVDPDHPLLFLLPRRDIAVLGANQAAVTAYRKLLVTGTGPIADPVGRSQAIAGDGTPADHAPLLQRVFGAFIGELTDLGAWRSPPEAWTASAMSNRVATDGAAHGEWAPGRVRDSGAWLTYRLPGVALVDGWGRELLVTHAARGQRLRLQSAGRDGVFRWDPGDNGRIDADPAAAAAALRLDLPWAATGASGDDRRGDDDNITALMGE